MINQKQVKGRTSAEALTSTQGPLGVEDVPPEGDGLGHHLLVKSHSFGVVQGVAHQRGAKDVLHGLAQVGLVAHQRQGGVDVGPAHLPEEEALEVGHSAARPCENMGASSHQALGRVHHSVLEGSGRNLVQGDDGVPALQLPSLQQLLPRHLRGEESRYGRTHAWAQRRRSLDAPRCPPRCYRGVPRPPPPEL